MKSPLMLKSPLKHRYSLVGAVIGAGALAMAMGVPAASADATPSGTIYYNVNPIAVLGFPATAATPGQLPPPSVCVTDFGLACYGPQDFRTAYNIPEGDNGSGQTIVIVDAYGSPTLQSDLAVYDAEFGLPPANLNIFYPGGQPVFNPLQHHNETSWANETSLDVEMAHGLAPDATIDLVIAANNGGDVLNNAEAFAVDNHLGNVMSMSFGAPEADFNGNSGQEAQANAIYQQAAAQGMSVFSSSGDSGATDGSKSGAVSANFPASDPLVTSVGGTNLFLADDGSYQSEDVWNDATECPFGCTAGEFGATGGAPSVLFPTPSYQSGINNNSARTTSDVAFNASVYTATMIYLSVPGESPGFYFFGGTSEGSPSWAAITAIADGVIGQPLGQLNPLLYGIYGTSAYASDFNDVTAGDNGFNGPGFPAGTGYDIPTGLGTPNVGNLISSLAMGQ